MVHIGIMTVQFQLPGSASLKEKRQRLIRLRDRFGRDTNVAVCESDFQDSRDRSEWTYLAMASDKQTVDKMLSAIERFIAEEVDAVITQMQREYL
jgi:uncharacterized protein